MLKYMARTVAERMAAIEQGDRTAYQTSGEKLQRHFEVLKQYVSCKPRVRVLNARKSTLCFQRYGVCLHQQRTTACSTGVVVNGTHRVHTHIETEALNFSRCSSVYYFELCAELVTTAPSK